MGKIAYIIAHTTGSIEEFFIPEMLSLIELGADILIIPRDISQKLFHKKALPLLKNTLMVPRFNIQIAKESLKYIFRNPISFYKIIKEITFKARNSRIALKNILIFPKAVYLSIILDKGSLSHIHAHWGSTTSTMAYIMSKITNVPWSLTLHRWDIYENNILKEKVKSASFVRCISEKGKTDLLKIIGNEFAYKVKVIHLGVEIPYLDEDIVKNKFKDWDNPEEIFKIVVPASFLPVKGHEYLIRACSILIQKKFLNYECIFYGNGPLQDDLEILVKQNNLSKYINVHGGKIPHEQLMALYHNRKVDLVILPSIITEDGEFEGIPVSLMEAMSYAIPVISTITGSIIELLSNDAGILVRQKSPEDLADAILKLLLNKKLAVEVGLKGLEKVKSGFFVLRTTESLLEEIRRSCN